MLLVVFSSGCIDFGGEDEDKRTNGVYVFSLSLWVNVTGGASATVIQTTPSSGIKWSDITWQLYNYSIGDVETGAVFTHYLDVDNDGCLEAGDKVMVTTGKAGTYKVRAIHHGSMIYESPTFIL